MAGLDVGTGRFFEEIEDMTRGLDLDAGQLIEYAQKLEVLGGKILNRS